MRGDPLKPATKEMLAKIDALRGAAEEGLGRSPDSLQLGVAVLPLAAQPADVLPRRQPSVEVARSAARICIRSRPTCRSRPDPAQERARLARLDTVEKYTGGITLDLTGAEAYGTVVALQESPISPGLLLAGTDNGNVWMTHNDGGDVGEPDVQVRPARRAVGRVRRALEPSHFDTLTFYVAFENHRWNDFTPYLFVTNDGGKSFRSIVNNLPKTSPADYLHVIREDPHNRDLLFVGSSRSVYASIDRGRDWTQVRDELPDGAGVRSSDSSARSRADRGDARPQPVDRRHRGARADDAEGARAGHVSLRAEDRVPVG